MHTHARPWHIKPDRGVPPAGCAPAAPRGVRAARRGAPRALRCPRRTLLRCPCPRRASPAAFAALVPACSQTGFRAGLWLGVAWPCTCRAAACMQHSVKNEGQPRFNTPVGLTEAEVGVVPGRALPDAAQCRRLCRARIEQRLEPLVPLPLLYIHIRQGKEWMGRDAIRCRGSPRLRERKCLAGLEGRHGLRAPRRACLLCKAHQPGFDPGHPPLPVALAAGDLAAPAHPLLLLPAAQLPPVRLGCRPAGVACWGRLHGKAGAL